MKKFLFFLSPILIILFLIPNCIYVNATSPAPLPVPTPATFQVIEGGMQSSVEMAATWKGLSPYSDALIASYELFSQLIWQTNNLTGDSIALYTCDTDDVETYVLTDDEIDYLNSDVFTGIYDRDGNKISVSTDNVYRCHYDNGFFHGNCYIKPNGELLYYRQGVDGAVQNIQHQLVDIAFGGSQCDLGDWNTFLNVAVQEVSDNHMYDPSIPIGSNDLSFLCHVGSITYNYSGLVKQTAYFYSPNVYDPNFMIRSDSSSNDKPVNLFVCYNGDRYDISNYADFKWTSTKDGSDYPDAYMSLWYFSSSSASIGNNTFDHYFQINTGNNPESMSYNEFVNYVPPFGTDKTYLFSLKPFSFNESIRNEVLSQNKTIDCYKTLQFPEGSYWPYLDRDLSMEIDDLHQLLEDIETQLQVEPNPSYDPARETDLNNYPLTTTAPLIESIPSILPNINTGTNPNPNPNPDVEDEPVPAPQPDGNGTGINFPVFNGLESRFPFCIPWDLMHLIKSFQVSPSAPAWDFDWSITCFGHTYTTHFQGDLSDYAPLAELLRNLFFISFMIALCVFSYKMFF